MNLQRPRCRVNPRSRAGCVQLLVLSASIAFSTCFQSFDCPSLRRQTSQGQRHVSSLCDSPHRFSSENALDSSDLVKNEARSSFWYTSAAANDEAGRLPSDRDLDHDGELPPGAYMTLNKKRDVELKKMCRLSVGLGLFSKDDKELEPNILVAQLNAFVDAGLTSFQVSSQSDNHQEGIVVDMIKKFRREVPAYQVDRCHFTLPLEMPSHCSALSVRNSVLDLLRRTGGHDLDCLQLQYNQESPYCFDVLDYLHELQREGFVRSVSAAKMPETIIRQALSYGFLIDHNTIQCNLLDPIDFQRHAADASVPLILSSPLAAGLLTERQYQNRKSSLPPQPTSSAERLYLRNSLPLWKQRHDEAILAKMKRPRDRYADDDTAELRRLLSLNAWSCYQEVVLDTIYNMSRKHGVSMASVVLRWTLQLDQAAGTVVSSRFSCIDTESLGKRPRQLRQVFTFELDDEDMGRLWQATGFLFPGEDVEQSILATGQTGEGEEAFFDMVAPQANGLFLSPRTRTSSRNSDTAKKTLFL